MIPGREYCYKVTATHNALDNGEIVLDDDKDEILVSEVARAEPKCITIGNTPVLAAPLNLDASRAAIFTNGLTRNKAYKFSWDPVEGADYYQLDRNVDYGTPQWEPIYIGTSTKSYQYLFEKRNEGFRISACKDNGVCGNYTRLYFYVYGDESINFGSLTKTPTCLNAPTAAAPGQSVEVSWCAPVDTSATRYRLSNSINADKPMFDANTDDKTSQLLFRAQLTNLVQGNLYCFAIEAEVNNVWYKREEQACTQVSMNTPGKPTITVNNATNGDFTLAWAAQDNTSWYQVQEAFCGSSCTNLTEADWTTLTPNTMATANPTLSWVGKRNGTWGYRLLACTSANVCSNYSEMATTEIKRRSVVFIHSDLLGTPVAETYKDGYKLQ
jgi:hypothetical protein